MIPGSRSREDGAKISAGRRTMEIVPVANVAQCADKAAVSRAVVELAFDPAFAVVEKFDQQVEHVHGFCGTVGVARHDCGSLSWGNSSSYHPYRCAQSSTVCSKHTARAGVPLRPR